jgi:hypothetical protein
MRFQVTLWIAKERLENPHHFNPKKNAIDLGIAFMEDFDKTRPDYADPAKVRETIDVAVNEAIQKDRAFNRGILIRLFQQGIRGGFVIQDPSMRGAIVRWDAEDAHRLANEIFPLPVEVPRG